MDEKRKRLLIALERHYLLDLGKRRSITPHIVRGDLRHI
jgi:hypothetical protein